MVNKNNQPHHTTIKKLKHEFKNDYGNTFKKIKDQIGRNL